MTDLPDPDLIDELASRLLDDDISLTEIDSSLHASVLARRAVFAAHRDRLRRETPVSTSHSGSGRSHSLRYTVLGLAAATLVGLVGIAVASRQHPTDNTTTADNTTGVVAKTAEVATSEVLAAASMAPEAAPMAADSSGMASRAVVTCVDPLGRPSVFVGYYNGEQVDVHFSATDGVAVYRTSDCTPVLDIVP